LKKSHFDIIVAHDMKDLEDRIIYENACLKKDIEDYDDEIKLLLKIIFYMISIYNSESCPSNNFKKVECPYKEKYKDVRLYLLFVYLQYLKKKYI
jgi:hypothetical protein